VKVVLLFDLFEAKGISASVIAMPAIAMPEPSVSVSAQTRRWRPEPRPPPCGVLTQPGNYIGQVFLYLAPIGPAPQMTEL
jgi:hypothetical protein